jgi:hypothetical protein
LTRTAFEIRNILFLVEPNISPENEQQQVGEGDERGMHEMESLEQKTSSMETAVQIENKVSNDRDLLDEQKACPLYPPSLVRYIVSVTHE